MLATGNAYRCFAAAGSTWFTFAEPIESHPERCSWNRSPEFHNAQKKDALRRASECAPANLIWESVIESRFKEPRHCTGGRFRIVAGNFQFQDGSTGSSQQHQIEC